MLHYLPSFWNQPQILLPPITKFSAKLDLGATAPPHDGNHSTCGYLGVIWTPWRDSSSQIGLIPLSLCRGRRSKKVTHFPALWKCQDMAWANPGIERRLQPWLWRSLSYRRKAQLPSFTAIHHSHHASPCRTWFRSRRTKDYHNSVIFTTWVYYENENYYFFCFYCNFFGSYSFFLGIDIFFDENPRAFQKYQLFY